MKKFLKIAGIVFAVLFVLALIGGGYLYFKFKDLGKYPSGGPLSPWQAQYDVLFYDINLDVNAADKTIAGYTTIKLRSLSDELARIKLDFLDNYTIRTVIAEEQKIAYQRDRDTLWLQLNRPLAKGEVLDVTVDYEGKPLVAALPPWMGGFNWSKDANGDDWIGLSCEGEGAKIWFPSKDHPSDEPDSVALHITVPQPYFVAASGILTSVTSPRNGFSTYHWITHYPINNYCVNIAIAKYETVERTYTALDGKTMPVLFYVLPQDRAKADSLIGMAVDMLKTYRKFFGEYPFINEKFALVETDYLGMEHQTLNAYGNGFKNEELFGHRWDELMLHEMGHEWWGNKVSARDWADFWIHEGICSYGEALYQLDKNGERGYHAHMQKLKKQIANKTPVIVKKDANTAESYNGDIYSKGAYLMHSLRYLLGDSAFFKTLYQFANDSAYTYKNLVSTDDLIALVNHNSGTDLTPFLRQFLYTTTLPEIHITKTSEKHYRIALSNCDFTLPMEIRTSRGNSRCELTRSGVEFESDTEPVVDENGWFLKTIIRQEP